MTGKVMGSHKITLVFTNRDGSLIDVVSMSDHYFGVKREVGHRSFTRTCLKGIREFLDYGRDIGIVPKQADRVTAVLHCSPADTPEFSDVRQFMVIDNFEGGNNYVYS